MVNQRTQINSISINGRLMLNLHSLNNEGGEGNQILTRIVTILDKNGELASVNAISGDMFKHIQSDHLIKILNEQGIALCNNCKLADPNRISGDDEFIKYIKDKKPLDSELMQAMLKKCACDDLEGILITEGRNTARKSVVEFGWVVGIPEQTITENFFHVKFASDASKKKGEAKESKEERASNKGQNIFHRPTNSGNYATVLHLETSRIGFNDYSRVYEITEEERQQRYEALLKSVLYTYMNPEGAMRAAQNPHIVNFEGVISYSTSATPAPTVSALTDSYDEEIKEIAEALNTMEGKSEDVVYLKPFKSMSEFVKAMTELVQTTSPGMVGGINVDNK